MYSNSGGLTLLQNAPKAWLLWASGFAIVPVVVVMARDESKMKWTINIYIYIYIYGNRKQTSNSGQRFPVVPYKTSSYVESTDMAPLGSSPVRKVKWKGMDWKPLISIHTNPATREKSNINQRLKGKPRTPLISIHLRKLDLR